MSVVMEIARSLLFPNREQHAIPVMDGAYSPNNLLEELPAVRAELSSPDDVAAGDAGALFVTSGRRLLRLDGESFAEAAVIVEFEAPISALACLADGSFVVGLNGAGLRHVDAAGRTVSKVDQFNGTPLRCVTAIAEDPQRGGVYFTVGSSRHDAEDWVWDLMERNRSGALGYWPPDADSAEVLLDKLAYANGVQVEDSGESLLFTQSWNHCLARYRLSGGAHSGFDLVIDNMPGYPARIAAASGGGHWLALFAMRTQLVELVLKERAFASEMMRTLEPALWIRPALKTAGSHLEPLQGGGIKKLGIRKPWAPPRSYGLVLRLDGDCEALYSLQSRVDGKNHGVTAAREIGSRLFVVSKGNDRILVQDLEARELNHA
jgi:sugar lactone lactonase YvrE